ncbi:SET domain-containing protein [Dendrothele bispora CBS 962.96]|uniref:Histone-lysine N-methyltransferase SET5 n=1 Tax=Dendrothele bispora (strain CBS 962.96) TaxID=1314807 RepID=A0A4S8MKX9_DENBC|nr:SET domain-containing protein [Dendrothele bispora CBS 962.96]
MATPTDVQLKDALISLKSSNPTLGISKVHSLLLKTHPEWLVSEKRTRKILQNEGLTIVDPTSVNGNSPSNKSGGIVYPSSRLIPNLDVAKWTSKVEVKYFNKKKGKGLIAKEKIKEGETIWKEDPFVIAPEWEIYDFQTQSAGCSFCTTPFSSTVTASQALITSCPASTSSTPCPARFCNRLCLARSAKHHSFLCPAQNPASVPLMKWGREIQWMGLHALAQLTSRILTVSQLGDDKALLEEEWRTISGFATMSLEDREKYHFKGQREPDQAGWKRAHQLYIEAFKEPKSPADQKKLAKLMKKPLKRDIDRGLFEYESFLKNLGKMSLNMEAHGGLYLLHSHLNHSCTPSVSVRHLDQRTALARITVIAKQDIEPGEELFITYVNPQLGLRSRQNELEAWGFGKCACKRCVEEEKEERLKESQKQATEGKEELGAKQGEMDMVDLERELKAGLGVM